jgi:hypothetical protein
MAWCPSCGGVIGRDCFNVDECAWRTQEMQRVQYADTARQIYDTGNASLIHELNALKARLADLELKQLPSTNAEGE